MSAAFDPTGFFADASSLAASAMGRELFGLLKRSLELPADFCALVTNASGDLRLCEPSSVIADDDVSDVLLVRVSPLSLSLSVGSLPSADGYLCDAVVSVQLRVLADRGELESFRAKIVGSDRRVGVAAIESYLQAATDDALREAVGRASAADLLDGDGTKECARAAEEALEGLCFAGGLVLEQGPRVTLESAAYAETLEVRQQASKKLDEHEASSALRAAVTAAQQEKLEHVESMLARLRQLADASPDVGLPELMRSFDESQRGQLYQALFHARAPQRVTRWIAVVAGRDLSLFEPGSAEKPVRTLTIDGEAGALRSVQLGPPARSGGPQMLLIGAARGVYEVPADASSAPSTYIAASDDESRGGFNAAAADENRIAATHSQCGLIVWARDKPDKPTCLLSERTSAATTVRNALFTHGRLWCSIDDRIVSLPADDLNAEPETIVGSRSAVTSLCVGDDGIFAGNADGQVLFWDDPRSDKPAVLHAGSRRAAESVGLLTAGGITRLLYTDTSLAVFSRVVGDTFTCRYEAGGQTIRRAEFAPDWIAATNDVRDRVILWTPNKPSCPAAILLLTRMTGRSVQDVCFVPVA